jgi:hypothetical protein
MRNLLALLGFALVAFLVVGWYLDWYHIGPNQIDINSKKVSEDVNKGIKSGEERVHDLLDKDGRSAPSGTPR